MGAGQSADETALYAAAVRGESKKVTQLLKKGIDPNHAHGQHGWTALHGAAYQNANEAAECIDLLIKAGAHVMEANEDGHSALHVALIANHQDLAQKLIDAGATLGDDMGDLWKKVFVISTRTPDGKPDVARLFISAKGDVNYKIDEMEQRPLHEAASRGMIEIMNVLLSAPGIVVDAPNIDQATALHLACANGKVAAMELLISKGAKLMARDKEGNIPAHYAAREQRADVLAKLYEADRKHVGAANAHHWTLLHTALYFSKTSLDCVKVTLANGEDVHARTSHGSTALHVAASLPSTTAVRLMLDKGAKVNDANDMGVTALHKACDKGYADTVTMLIAAGADVNAVNKDGWDPLHVAAHSSHMEIVQILVDAGADISTKNSMGLTALDVTLAQRSDDVSHMLIDSGAHAHVNQTSLQAALQDAQDRGDHSRVKVLQRAATPMTGNASLDSTTPGSPAIPTGPAPAAQDAQLLAACRAGETSRVKTLLDGGANVNAQTATGESPLMLALMYGHDDLAVMLLKKGVKLQHDAAMRTAESRATGGATFLHRAIVRGEDTRVELMLEAYTSLGLTDSHGDTALHVAAYMDNETYLTMLIQTGAVDVNARNHRGQTPLHRAVRSPACFRVLVTAGAQLDVTDTAGRAVLSYVAENGDLDKAVYLLSAGADATLRDNDGKDALCYVCLGAKDTTTAVDVTFDPLADERVQCAKTLLAHGANIDAKVRSNGGWPLVFAVRACNAPLVQFLVSQGADLGQQGQAGERAIDIARRTNLAIAAVLEDAMRKAGAAPAPAGTEPPNTERAKAFALDAMLLEFESWKARVVRLENENNRLKQEVRELRKQTMKSSMRNAEDRGAGVGNGGGAGASAAPTRGAMPTSP